MKAVNTPDYKKKSIENAKKVAAKKIFMFDVDGTIALGDSLFDGVKQLFEELRLKNKSIYIMTNNSSKTPQKYLDNLKKAGLCTESIEIISSLDIALHYFKKNNIEKLCYAANSAVSRYIAEKGFIYDETSPQALLLTYDTELNYGKLLLITRLINENIPYYATHTDLVCPTGLGYCVPDIGCVIESLRLTTGKTPVKTFGKPDAYGIRYAAKKEGVFPAAIVVAGDRLYTDIQAALNAEAFSVLVLSGETTIDMYEKSTIKADIVIDRISELIKYL